MRRAGCFLKGPASVDNRFGELVSPPAYSQQTKFSSCPVSRRSRNRRAIHRDAAVCSDIYPCCPASRAAEAGSGQRRNPKGSQKIVPTGRLRRCSLFGIEAWFWGSVFFFFWIEAWFWGLTLCFVELKAQFWGLTRFGTCSSEVHGEGSRKDAQQGSSLDQHSNPTRLFLSFSL